MANPNLSTFSLSHVGILDGTTGAEAADLFAVNEGSLELESDSYDRTGDDRIISTNRWITKGTLSVSTNYMPLDVMALLYGTSVVSGASGISMQLWAEGSMNTVPRPVVIEAPGEDGDGVRYKVKFILYRVKFGQISFGQFTSYKEGLAVSLEGDALLSTKDELGQAFADNLGARIGKIVAVTL